MSKTKKTPTTFGTNLQALKIGSRVRCSDDGVEGRIVWANGVSVKIRWDDGEKVTWRRDSLADRPIEILEGCEDQSPSAKDANTLKPTEQIESPPVEREEVPTTPVTEASPLQPAPCVVEPSDQHVATEPATAEQPSGSPAEPTESSLAIVPEMPLPADSTVENTSLTEPVPQEQTAPDPVEQQPTATSTRAKQPRQRNRQKAAEDGKEKKLSALDAAAKVLAETATAMTCQELIAAMAAKGYWSSPGGRTPQATLYSAMLREIATKGETAVSRRPIEASSPTTTRFNTSRKDFAHEAPTRGFLSLVESPANAAGSTQHGRTRAFVREQRERIPVLATEMPKYRGI